MWGIPGVGLGPAAGGSDAGSAAAAATAAGTRPRLPPLPPSATGGGQPSSRLRPIPSLSPCCCRRRCRCRCRCPWGGGWPCAQTPRPSGLSVGRTRWPRRAWWCRRRRGRRGTPPRSCAGGRGGRAWRSGEARPLCEGEGAGARGEIGVPGKAISRDWGVEGESKRWMEWRPRKERGACV